MEVKSESNLESIIYRESKLNYNQVFNLKKNNEIRKYFHLVEKNNYFIIQDFDRKFFDYFFYEPLIIKYSFTNDNDNNNEIKLTNIYSTEQIEKYNKDQKVNYPHIVFNNIKTDYEKAKVDIYNYIQNNELIITNEENYYEDNFIFDNNLIKNNKFKKETLSKYFDNYFIYNKKEEKEFEYEETESRLSLIKLYLNKFILIPNLRFFKFCGPSSTGKSTTLLKFSREHTGIVYLNIKAIYELECSNRLKDCFNLITYELRRLYISDEEKKKSFKEMLKENRNNNPWEFILNVIKLISNTPNIIIFDQYKKSYLPINIYSQIEDNVKKSELKLIVCSSINNKDIRDEVIKTFEQYKGNPKDLNDKSQYFYFYFYNIFFNKKVENDNNLNPLFELFDYRPKYKYLLSNTTNINNCITETKSKIKSKIKEFFMFEQDFDLCKIILHIKNNINIKLSFDNDSDIEILRKLPLKYYIVRLNNNYFEIDYAFKFIKLLEKEIISIDDCDNYFKLKKYNSDKSLDGKVKGEYFEMSARFFIRSNDVLPAKIDDTLNVKNIVGLEPLIGEETLDNIINSINLTIKDDSSFDSKEIEELIKDGENLLNEENIKTEEDLKKKYSCKNLDYYYRNTLLNYFSNLKKKDKKKTDDKKAKSKEKEFFDEIEDEDEKLEKNKQNKKSKQKKNEKSKNKEKSGKEEENECKMLQKKTRRQKQIESINGKNILIEQEQVNGKTLDQAFIYSDKDEKYIFIGLQMKCLSNKTNHSTTLKGLTKENIKNNCQTILLRANIDLGIYIKEWHYFIIAYYNEKDLDNEFCKQLQKHCKNQDIPIVYYNPEIPSLYINNVNNNKFEKLKKIQPSNLSNLDYDFPLSNSYNLFDNNFTDNLINSYYKQRMSKILKQDKFYKDEESLEKSYYFWLQNLNLKMKNVEENIAKHFKIKKLKLVECYDFDVNMTFPTPSENHMFLFAKNEKNLIGLLNKKVLEAKDLETGITLRILELPKFVDINKTFYIFMVE